MSGERQRGGDCLLLERSMRTGKLMGVRGKRSEGILTFGFLWLFRMHNCSLFNTKGSFTGKKPAVGINISIAVLEKLAENELFFIYYSKAEEIYA